MKKFISFFLFILTFQLSAFSQLGFVNSFNYVGYDTPALQDCPMKIGSAVTAIDDHNSNGVRELVFGDFTDDKYGYSNGAIWVAYITSFGFVDSVKRIDQYTPNFNFTINDSDQFGYSITTVGDLDGNGYTDLAVGAPGDDDGNWNTGAIYILFFDTNATLLNTKKISNANGQFTAYLNGEELGIALGIGADINLDGNQDLLVGMPFDNDGGNGRGAVLTLFMTDSGTVQSIHKTSAILGGSNFITQNNCHFGTSMCVIPDLNGDGYKDMVVGADNVVTAGSYAGGVFVCFLDSLSNVIDYQLITNGYGNLSTGISTMGSSVVSISDFNNDNLPDIAVGMRQYQGGRFLALALDTNGTVKVSNYLTIPSVAGNLLSTSDEYASGAVAFDLNGDTIIDIIGSAPYDDDGYIINSGALYVSFLNSTATGTLGGNKISFLFGGLESRLVDNSDFGFSIDTIGDVDGDGNTDLIVGAKGLRDGNVSNIATGAVYILLTNADGTIKKRRRISYSRYPEIFGAAGGTGWDVAGMGDFNGDGIGDILVGTPYANVGGTRRGKVQLIYLNADMTIQSYRTYAHGEPGFPISLDNYDNFGIGVTNLGDVDGDGITDIAVSATGDDGNATTSTVSGYGCIYVMLLNADGSVKSYKKITLGIEIQPYFINTLSLFGTYLSAMGDIDGDGVPDMAANYYTSSTSNNGNEMSIMFLNSDGSLKGQRNLRWLEVGGTSSTINLNNSFVGGVDLNLDGTPDMVMGTPTSNKYYYIFLNDTAGVVSYQVINTTNGNLNTTFANNDRFGGSFAFIGDRTGDGVPELAVGAYQDRSSTAYASGEFGAAFLLSLNSPFLANAGNSITSCDTIQLGGNPTAQGGTWPLTYHWSPGNLVSDSTAANPYFTGNQQTTLTLTVTDSNGVVISDQVTVSTSPMQLTSQLTQPISCFGAADAEIQLAVTGNVGTTSYILNNDTNSTGIFSGLGTGTYIPIVVDSSGCSQTLAAIQLVAPAPVSFTITNSGNLLCANDSNATIQFYATGGNGSYYYSIDTVSFLSTDLFQNLGAGDYALTVKDTAGCLADTQMITISAPNPFFLTGTIEAISCHNYQDGSIDGLAVGGTGAISYTLNGSTTQASGLFQNLGAGFYTMVATDSNGCTSNTISLALQNPFPMVVSLFTQQSILCANTSTGILFAAQINGNLPISYSLNGGPLSALDTFVNLSAGAYSVTAIDAKGCTTTSQIANLYNPPVLTGSAQIIQNISCYNGSDGSVQLAASGGTPIYTYSLDGNNFITSAVITNISAGIYTPAVKDQKGCITNVGQISLSNPNQITITSQISNETTAGNDGTLTLIANGGAGNFTYSLDGTTYQSSPIFAGLASGLVSFFVKDANGCIETGNAFIDSSVGIAEFHQQAFSIYPNPARNFITITHNSSTPVSLYVTNQLGQIVMHKNQLQNNQQIDIKQLADGMYSVQLINNNQRFTSKLVIVGK